MATITISRLFGSHGDTVAQLLCEALDYRYFDKHLMLGLAVQAGLPTEKVAGLAEEPRRARTLVERLFGNFASPMGDPNVWAASASVDAQEQITAVKLKHLILAAHEQGNVVIIGRGGQCVLHGLPDVVHVRIIAPLELRIQRHAERAGLSPDDARQVVLKRDQASIDYVQRFYNLDPANLELYDLVLNTGRVKPSVAAGLIVEAVSHLPVKS